MNAWFRLIVIAVHLFVFHDALASPDFFVRDERATELSVHVKRLAEVPPEDDAWNARKGPWSEYLQFHHAGLSTAAFVAQLSEKERILYEASLRTGQCALVRALQEAGFLLTFPFLQPAHADAFASLMFRETVARKSVDNIACAQFRHMRQVYAYAEKQNFRIGPLDFRNGQEPYTYPRPLQKDEERSITDRERARANVCIAVKWLLPNALSSNSPELLGGILRLARTDELVRFSDEQLFAINLRADQLGLNAKLQGQGLVPLHYSVSARQRAKVVRAIQDGETFKLPSLNWYCPLNKITYHELYGLKRH